MDYLLLGIAALMVGVLLDRLVLHQRYGRGGGQLFIGPYLVQVPRLQLTQILAAMSREEQTAYALVLARVTQQEAPTGDEIAAAKAALSAAGIRWLHTTAGRSWATQNAPHLLQF